jgi:5-methylcytosine-specific restriction enzyme subunit McrC
MKALSFELGENGLSIASFVVNMEKVFEDFVTAALTEAWGSGVGRTERQFPVKLDNGGAISMNVDVVHLIDDAPRFIVDAKYKPESASGRYPNTDLYQVLTYCTALRIDRAWLVYAGDAATATPHHILNSPIIITTYALDLGVPAQDLIAQIERLARSAVETLSGHLAL